MNYTVSSPMVGQRMADVEHWVRGVEEQLDAAGLYFGHGTDNALDEAAWLVLHCLNIPLDGLFEDWSRTVSDSQAEQIRQLLAQRMKSRKPLAYLVGEANFCGLKFKVNEHVLVPRSPIAELIRSKFQPWLGPRTVTRALDLCTGSGCIAIAMAQAWPELQVDAADISSAALDIARENVRIHALGERVHPLHSDGFSALQGRRYDLVVTNPPYVPSADLDGLPAEFRAEPALGLESGRDGLDLPLAILAETPDHLTEHGILFCEVGASAGTLQALLNEVAFTWLEFEHGGEGVFTMTRQELLAARSDVNTVLEQRKNVR